MKKICKKTPWYYIKCNLQIIIYPERGFYEGDPQDLENTFNNGDPSEVLQN